MDYAIIENEEFARINLQEVIETVRPSFRCRFTAETVEDSVRLLAAHRSVELIFMDIELDDGNCFEIFRRTAVRTPVIFTTAYDEYAIQAFKVNSIDYLLKPVAEDDVERAIRKFESMQAALLPDYGALAARLAAEARRYRSRILISNTGGYTFVDTGEIAWFEAEDKYVSVVLRCGKHVLTDFASLADVADALDPERFFPVSRSVVASVDAIRRIAKFFKGRLRVTLAAEGVERTETVSAARRPDFLGWLGHVDRNRT